MRFGSSRSRRSNRFWIAAGFAALCALPYACESDSNTVSSPLDKGTSDVVATQEIMPRLDIVRPARLRRSPAVGPGATNTPLGGGPAPTNTPGSPVPPTNTPAGPPPPPTSTPGGIPPTATPPPPPPPTLTPTPIPTQIPPPTSTPTVPAGPGVSVRLRAVDFQWDFVAGPTISKDASYPGQNTVTLRVGVRYNFAVYNGGIPGTPPHAFSGIAALGLSGAALDAGSPDFVQSIVPTTSGTFEFNCTDTGCGTGHDRMHAFVKVVP